MNIKIKTFGSPIHHTIIMTVENNYAQVESDIVNLKGLVDESLVSKLREVADDLERHNANVNARLAIAKKVSS